MVSPNVGRKLVKALLAFDPEHHDDYKELYENHNLRLLSCIANGCIIENEELPAVHVLGSRFNIWMRIFKTVLRFLLDFRQIVDYLPVENATKICF